MMTDLTPAWVHEHLCFPSTVTLFPMTMTYANGKTETVHFDNRAAAVNNLKRLAALEGTVYDNIFHLFYTWRNGKVVSITAVHL